MASGPQHPANLASGLRQKRRHCKLDKFWAFMGFFPFQLAVAASGSPSQKLNPKPLVTQKPTPKTKNPHPNIQNPKPQTPKPTPKIKNPKPKMKNPTSKIQIQNPEPKTPKTS